MTKPRQAYIINVKNPSSDLAREIATIMASVTIVFRHFDHAYSNELLNHAKDLFTFFEKYKGKYDNNIIVSQTHYALKSGYTDELLWEVAWLHEATGDLSYCYMK